MSETLNVVDRRELVSFRLDKQEFCLDIMNVREIRGWTEITALPHAPHYVPGVINLRGTVLPIVDMRARFGLPIDATVSRRVIIVVWINSKLIGLLVDAVCDIIAVPAGALQPAPALAGEMMQKFVNAVLNVDDRMVCLIALDHLLPELDAVAA